MNIGVDGQDIMERTQESEVTSRGRLSHFSGNYSREQNRVFAAGLLSQQIWCWGQDIERADGNWLQEVGFDRATPPEEEKDCASVYRRELPRGQRIVLRGFGVFFGDNRHGGIFVERFGFSPQYTQQSRLAIDAWSCEDLPPMAPPRDDKESIVCRLLVMGLTEWIVDYEWQIRERLGAAYRCNSLRQWNNGKRFYLPEEHMMSAWRQISLLVGSGRLCIQSSNKS
jgi:hypothetical protein